MNRPATLLLATAAVGAAALLTASCSSGVAHHGVADAAPRTAVPSTAVATASAGSMGLPGSGSSSSLDLPRAEVPPTLLLPGASAHMDLPTCTLVVSYPDASLGFGFDSAAIAPDKLPVLTGLADYVKTADRVRIDGWSSAEGDYQYNVDLSRRRAQAVRDVIAPALPHATIQVFGRGPARPLAQEPTEADRVADRKVVIAAHLVQNQCS